MSHDLSLVLAETRVLPAHSEDQEKGPATCWGRKLGLAGRERMWKASDGSKGFQNPVWMLMLLGLHCFLPHPSTGLY